MAFPIDVRRRIAQDNLHMQENDVSRCLEARRSHLSDLVAVLIADNGISLDTIGADSFFSDGQVGQLHKEVREENRRSLSAILGTLTAHDRAVIAELVVTHMERLGTPIAEASFFVPREVYDRIAYVRNAYTDEAFDAFSQEFDHPTALFCDSYEEACGEIANGSAGYCILPIRDTTGAYHRAAITYLLAHSLMAVSTITVYDGEDVPMQYALCAKAPLGHPNAWECIIAFPKEWGTRLPELSQATASLGLTLGGVLYDGTNREVILTVNGKDSPLSFLTWMRMFAPASRIIGYYLKEEQ